MIVREVQLMREIALGEWTPHTIQQAKAALSVDLDRIVAAHQFVSSTYPPNTPYMQWWNTGNLFPFVQLQNGGSVTRNNTLAGGVSEFLSSVQVVLSLPIENCTLDNKFVYYITENAELMTSALQTSVRLRFEKYASDFAVFNAKVCTM